jgi:Flp pilus assembly protein TadG
MQQHRQISALVRHQQGGIGFHVLWVMFLILLLAPFFWDIANVFYARGSARTAADAATLAAAQEYADRLQRTTERNGIFRGQCSQSEYTPRQVVQRYLTNPTFTASPAIGIGIAHHYAAINQNKLLQYRSWPEYSGRRTAAGMLIPVIKVYGETQRPIHMAYRSLYGRDFDIANQAVAVVYLKQWRMTARSCYEAGTYTGTTYDFTFMWAITLDALPAQQL